MLLVVNLQDAFHRHEREAAHGCATQGRLHVVEQSTTQEGCHRGEEECPAERPGDGDGLGRGGEGGGGGAAFASWLNGKHRQQETSEGHPGNIFSESLQQRLLPLDHFAKNQS